MKRNKGFTLVELIIVIAVIGVLAAILIPVFSNVIEKSNQKSALSDAVNATKSYVAELETKEAMRIPNVIATVHKGNKVYVTVYTDNSDGIQLLEGVTLTYSSAHGIEVCGCALIADLESQGFLTPSPYAGTFPDPNAILSSLGYDTRDGIYLDADYLVNIDIIGDATTSGVDMSGIPTPTPREPDPVVPTFNSATETFTFVITSRDVAPASISPTSASGSALSSVTVCASLDFSPVLEKAAGKMATSRWYGYDIQIINNTGHTLVVGPAKIDIANTPSIGSDFVCAFVNSGDNFSDFVTAFNDGNPANTSEVTFLTMGNGENVFNTVTLAPVTGTGAISGSFFLGYTGSLNPASLTQSQAETYGELRDTIATATAKVYLDY